MIHNIKGVSMYVLFGVQLAAALYLKHESTLYSLYIIPITGALLCAVSLYHFPTRCTFKIVLASGLFAVYLLCKHVLPSRPRRVPRHGAHLDVLAQRRVQGRAQARGHDDFGLTSAH